MIKSIELKNIQSHEHTILNFDEGINCIVGSSNNGKSAILRGLYFCRYNRPLGIDTLASHWALDKKGNLKDEMSVTVINENGKVIRCRTKNNNQYFINEKELNVVKSDVPSEVERTLSLSDTNIQKQLDEPFLLSETSGEVAKYFNHVVRLDIIDKVLTNAETTRRKINQQIQATKEQIEEQQKKLNDFDWLDKTGRLIHKWEVLQERQIEKLREYNLLNHQVISFEVFDEKASKLKVLSKGKNFIKEFEASMKDCESIFSKISELKDSINYYEELQEKCISKDFTSAKKLIKDIKSVDLDPSEIKFLMNSIEKFEDESALITDNKTVIDASRKKLPKICPVCGQPWECCKEL